MNRTEFIEKFNSCGFDVEQTQVMVRAIIEILNRLEELENENNNEKE